MIVYTRGQWGETPTMPDHWSVSSSDGLKYEGYETSPEWQFGDDCLMHIEVYFPTNEAFDSAKYRYFVHIGNACRSDAVLVTDFPSLLMLLKEILPLAREDREQEAHEMRVEEHRWKAKEHRETSGSKDCAHL